MVQKTYGTIRALLTLCFEACHIGGPSAMYSKSTLMDTPTPTHRSQLHHTERPCAKRQKANDPDLPIHN